MGLGNFHSRFLEMSSGVTVILLGILSRGFIEQFISLSTYPENKSPIEINASYVFVHSVIVVFLMTSSLETFTATKSFRNSKAE